MQSYEIITIVDPQVSDDEVLEATEKLNRLILNKGGTLGRVQRWGRRRLAYPIKRHTEGHYVLTHFVLDPQLTSELSTELQVSEEVLKHMIVKIEAEDFRIHEEPAEPKPKDEVAEVTSEVETTDATAGVETAAAASETETPEATAKTETVEPAPEDKEVEEDQKGGP